MLQHISVMKMEKWFLDKLLKPEEKIYLSRSVLNMLQDFQKVSWTGISNIDLLGSKILQKPTWIRMLINQLQPGIIKKFIRFQELHHIWTNTSSMDSFSSASLVIHTQRRVEDLEKRQLLHLKPNLMTHHAAQSSDFKFNFSKFNIYI